MRIQPAFGLITAHTYIHTYNKQILFQGIREQGAEENLYERSKFKMERIT
jgi:hypothetical protein